MPNSSFILALRLFSMILCAVFLATLVRRFGAGLVSLDVATPCFVASLGELAFVVVAGLSVTNRFGMMSWGGSHFAPKLCLCVFVACICVVHTVDTGHAMHDGVVLNARFALAQV